MCESAVVSFADNIGLNEAAVGVQQVGGVVEVRGNTGQVGDRA